MHVKPVTGGGGEEGALALLSCSLITSSATHTECAENWSKIIAHIVQRSLLRQIQATSN